MADTDMLDRAFHSVMQRFINTGQAPHYTELASEINLPEEEGRQLLHDFVNSGIPAGSTQEQTTLSPLLRSTTRRRSIASR